MLLQQNFKLLYDCTSKKNPPGKLGGVGLGF